MSLRNRANIKYKKRFDYKTNIHGQSCTIVRFKDDKRCPCFDEDTGYGDPQWHRDNPEADMCNSNGYLEGKKIEEDTFAFIYPKDSVTDDDLEVILANIGEIKRDDYVYIGKSDTDIFNLSKRDYIKFNNRKWKLTNPDVYTIGDIQLAYTGILSMIRDDYDGH